MTTSSLSPSAETTAEPDTFLTVGEVAKRYRATPETIYRHTRAGSLPCVKSCGKTLYSLRALEAHERRNTSGAA